MVVDSSPTARTFSPAQTSRSRFHPPTHRLLFNRLPRDVRFAHASTTLNDPSKLGCSFPRGQPGSVQTCALDRTPPLMESYDHSGVSRSASTRTDLAAPPSLWCARSASKGDQQPLRPRFLVCRGPRAQGLTRLIHLSGVGVGRAQRPSGCLPTFLPSSLVFFPRSGASCWSPCARRGSAALNLER